MSKKKSKAALFPFPILALLAFLCMGFIWDLWHPGWLVFLTVPIYYYIVNLIEARRVTFWKLLPYPMFCTIIYLCLGIIWDLWHPGWLIFLTIPIWSFFANDNSSDADDADEGNSNP